MTPAPTVTASRLPAAADRLRGGVTKLSIIIPTLNEADNIGQLLDDLNRGLARYSHEIIVVDGGSNDATVTQVRNRVDHCLSSPPGRAIQLNAGADIACGELLLFLHADSRIPTGSLNSLLLKIDSGVTWGRFDIRLSGHQFLLRVVEKMMNLRSRLTGIATGDQGLFVRRDLFDRVAGYPPITLMEDIALCRALKKTGPPQCLRAIITSSSRRWQNNGVVRTIMLMWWLRLAYFLGVSPQRLARWYRQ